MANDLTVSDLARFIAPLVSHPREPTEEDIEFAVRRIRNWTVAGALKPVGDPHSGSGKHRRYDDSSVYIAATLSVLADSDQSIGTLLTVALLIRNLFGDKPLIGKIFERWNQAVKGTEDIFLVLSTVRGKGDARQRGTAQILASLDEVKEALQNCRSGAFVNLTAIFAQLTL
jgi:hypothetical protein